MFDTEVTVDPLSADQERGLRIRLNSLPQELFDLIQHFTILAFIHSGPQECPLSDASQRAQHKSQLGILQLDRATRAQYAEVFYRRRTFTTTSAGDTVGLLRWLYSVTAEHRSFIGGIAVRTNGNFWVHPYQVHSVLKHVSGRFGIEIAEKWEWVSGSLGEGGF